MENKHFFFSFFQNQSALLSLYNKINSIQQKMYDRSDSKDRYRSPILANLLHRIGDQFVTREQQGKKKIGEQRKMSYSYSACMEKARQLQKRPLFNNKTKEGSFLDIDIKPIPYKFIPKYKNDTFIMPNRVFQKGKAGKRFYIKMRDTSIYSFRQQQSSQEKKVLNKDEKEKTILSRKVEEFNRIIDVEDGRVRALNNKELLKTRKQFRYTDSRTEIFSQSNPMLEPVEGETKMTRKTSLAKTFDFSNKWRPNSRGLNFFEKNVTKSAYSHYPQVSSVL